MPNVPTSKIQLKNDEDANTDAGEGGDEDEDVGC